MTRRKIEPPLPNKIKTKIDGLEHDRDLVKEVYRYSTYSAKSLARRLGCSRQIIEKYIAEGNWDNLRAEYRQRIYNTMLKDRHEILEMKQDIVQRFELFYMIMAKDLADDLEDHLLEHGDLFVRDSNDEVIRDSFGNPMYRRIGFSKTDLEQLKGLEAAREVNRQLLENATEELESVESRKQLKKGNGEDVIDAEIEEDIFGK